MLAITLVIPLFAVSGKNHQEVKAASKYGLSNPVITSVGGKDVTTWDCVWFGNYWQNDTNGDGTADQNDAKEPIKWRVLSVDGDDAFLLADKCLDCQRYNNSAYTAVTWETCTLRTWLNQDFYSSAFSSMEQSAVRSTNVINEDNPIYGTEGGNNTTDRVYLLSLSEICNSAYGFSTDRTKYDKARHGKATEYAKKQVWFSTGANYPGNSMWWLRSPGRLTNYASDVYSDGCFNNYGEYVYSDGCVNNYGGSVYNSSGGVRPALHLNLSSTVWSKAGTVSSDGSTDEIAPVSRDDTITGYQDDFTRQHLDFVSGQEYADRMDSRWAKIISQGLDTDAAKSAESIYKVLNSTSEILKLKSLKVFENPYDAIITQLILEQTDTKEKDFKLKFENGLTKLVSNLGKLCETSKYSDDWELKPSEYETVLEKLIKDPKNMEAENPAFYQMCEKIFKDLKQSDKLDGFLKYNEKAGELLDGLDDYNNIIEWVVDCVNFNSVVSAYLDTSEEFKASLLAAQYYMKANISNDEFSSRQEYSELYEKAVKKYSDFMTEDRVTEHLFEEYFVNGTKRILDVYGSTIMKNTVIYVSKGLGIPVKAASWLYVAIEAYKLGWSISEAITDNGTNFECREQARASYYLEDAMAWLVEDSAHALKESKSYQAAKNFDSAYSILQSVECYALENYKTYLESQQKQFVQALIHGLNWKYNMSEIAMIKLLELQWKYTHCHSDVSGSSDISNVALIKIDSTDDITVYDKDGVVTYEIKDGKKTKSNRKIEGMVENGISIFEIPNISDYQIEIKSCKENETNIYVDTYTWDDGANLSSSIYKNIQSNRDDLIMLNYDNANFIVTLNTEVIEPVFEESGENENSKKMMESIHVKNIPSKIRIGETVKLNTEILPEDTSCPLLNWMSSNENIAAVKAGVLTGKKPGTAHITCCAVDGSGITYEFTIKVLDKEGGDADIGEISGYSLTLNGNIGVNYYVEKTEDLSDDDYMEFDLPNGDTIQQKVSDAVEKTRDDKKYLVFTCEVSAKEMTEDIISRYIKADGTKGIKSAYNVQTYAKYILEHSDEFNEKTVSQVKAMLNYGAAAQKYFQHNRKKEEDLANSILSEDEKILPDVDGLDLSQFQYEITMDENSQEEGITYSGSLLVLKSETTIRHYFTLSEGKDIKDYTFTVDNKEVKPYKKDEFYCVDIPNISASNLGKVYTVRAGNLTLNNYSALSYGNSVLNLTDDSIVDTNLQLLKEVVAALVQYEKTAKESR